MSGKAFDAVKENALACMDQQDGLTKLVNATTSYVRTRLFDLNILEHPAEHQEPLLPAMGTVTVIMRETEQEFRLKAHPLTFTVEVLLFKFIRTLRKKFGDTTKIPGHFKLLLDKNGMWVTLRLEFSVREVPAGETVALNDPEADRMQEQALRILLEALRKEYTLAVKRAGEDTLRGSREPRDLVTGAAYFVVGCTAYVSRVELDQVLFPLEKLVAENLAHDVIKELHRLGAKKGEALLLLADPRRPSVEVTRGETDETLARDNRIRFETYLQVALPALLPDGLSRADPPKPAAEAA